MSQEVTEPAINRDPKKPGDAAGAARELPTAMIRVRVSQSDVHYGGGIVAGAKVMEYFGDVATELSIRYDGDEGLMAGYDLVEFKLPVCAGDYLEVVGKIVKVGNRSRRVEMEAYKVIEADPESGPTAAKVLPEPLLVARAHGTVVAPKPRG